MKAPIANGVVLIAHPAKWSGRGKVQIGGGRKARDKDSFTDLQITNADPWSFGNSFEVRWSSRDPGRLDLIVEWQPIAGNSWQPSDGSPRHAYVLTVVDPVTKPTVNFTGSSGVSDEGTAVSFTVSRTGGDTTEALTVLLTVGEATGDGQDFVASDEEGNKEVVIPAGSSAATYTVATTDDDVDERDGMVTVTIESGEGYTVGTSLAGVTKPMMM